MIVWLKRREMSSDCKSESGEFCTEIYNNEENRHQPEICSSSSDKQANETTTTEMTTTEVTANVSSKSDAERMVKKKKRINVYF